MKKALLIASALIALGGICIYAAPVPITTAQLGAQTVTITNFNNTVCPTGDSPNPGCGGAFTANIGSITGATIWCVDSQLHAHANSPYTAYIEDLNSTPHSPFNDANFVRYGGINTVGPTGWAYDLTPYGAANDAQTRYKLAAILITNYIPSADLPTDSTQNRAVQNAIWRLTENNVAAGTITGDISTGHPSGSDWIAYAVSVLNANTFDFSRWAVVSGGFDGTKLLDGAGAVQTFLVEVTPEPRFYGLLLAGLLAICGIVYKRRTAQV